MPPSSSSTSIVDTDLPHTNNNGHYSSNNSSAQHSPSSAIRRRTLHSSSQDDLKYLRTSKRSDNMQHSTNNGNAAGAADNKHNKAPASIWNEWQNLLLLIALYTLQGVPLGLCIGSIPFILQSKLSYSELAVFSLAAWPYSLKLLWSPLVDTLYSTRFGQRKSWIIPAQVVVGSILILLSYQIDPLIAAGDVKTITVWFFLLILSTATQDIAVDGWAVQLLSPENVSYSSTCQAVGQNIGFFLSYSVFLALNDPGFSNYLRAVPNDDIGLVTLNGYMFYWGIMYLVCTAYLLLFKKEVQYTTLTPAVLHNNIYSQLATEDANTADHQPPTTAQRKSSQSWKQLALEMREAYQQMWRTVQLPAVRQLILILLTSKVAFAASDNLTVLKMVERGFPKEKMALMAFLLFPFELVYPIIVGNWQKRASQPLQPFIYGYPFRQVITLAGAIFVYNMPSALTPLADTAGQDHPHHASDAFGWGFYAQVLGLQIIYSLAQNLMFVSQCGFFAQICDVDMGGSYMTLLNTVSNLGSAWPKPIVLTLTDWLTCKPGDKRCFTPVGTDGYYVLTIGCFVIGMTWYVVYLRKRIDTLGRLPKERWLVNGANRTS